MGPKTVKLTDKQNAELKALLENHLETAVKIQEGGCIYEIRDDGTIVVSGCYA